MALDAYSIYAASYADEADAVADYEAVGELYSTTDLVDTYDAAVISKDADGSVHVVKRVEKPTEHGAAAGLGIGLVGGVLVALFPAVTLGGALLVGGAAGAAIGAIAGHVSRGMSRGDLKDLGETLDSGTSGLVVAAATDVADRVNDVITRAQKVVSKQVRADDKQIRKDLDQLLAADS